MRVPVNEKRRRNAEWEPNEPRIPRGRRKAEPITVSHEITLGDSYSYKITMTDNEGNEIDFRSTGRQRRRARKLERARQRAERNKILKAEHEAEVERQAAMSELKGL